MGAQFFGLILLILSVSAGLYAVTNYGDLLNLRIEVPVSLQPAVSLPSYFSNPNTTVNQNAPTVPIAVFLVRPQTSYSYGEIVLKADWNIANSGIDIKGWKIGSLESDYTLPGAQNVYTFGGPLENLIVRPGDEVHIFSGISPRGNFRINKCIGYLSELGTFNPPLPQRCPAQLSEPDTTYLTNACKSYLSSLGSCQRPRNAPISFDDAACHNYLNNINYESCVSRHRNDQDFLDNEIWIWADDNLKYFDQAGDIVRIFDKSGMVVSQYRY